MDGFRESRAQQNFVFYKDRAGTRIARNETKKIVRATIRLKKQPEIGQVEELLKSKSNEFRYVVHQSFKIIYWINQKEKQVEIVDIFHTRQYPEKMKRTK